MSLPKEFLAFQISFGLLFPILMICAIFVLFNLKRPSKVHILMFSLMIYTCAIRTVWIWLDPFNSRKLINPVIENALYGNGLWSLLSVFLTILGLWYFIYLKTKHMGNAELRNKKTKRLILGLTAVLLAFLVTNTTLDILRSLTKLQSRENRMIVLGFYFLNITIFVGIPGILYFALGRKLDYELNRYNSINGIQIQDGYVRKIAFLTNSSCFIAIATVLTIGVVFAVVFILGKKGPIVPPVALIYHTVYRLLEVGYIICVLGIFYLKVNPKQVTPHYVRMK